MSLNPLFSVIIPSYNSAATIVTAVSSILNQSFKDFEILIFDSLSEDNTIDVLKEFTSDLRIKIFSEKDKGVYDAMNKGIDMANGEWLYFMGSDDILYSNTLFEELLNELNPDMGLIYGNVLFKNSKQVYSGPSSLMKLMHEEVSICHQAIFYNKKIFVKLGKYNLQYFIHADYDFNIRCFKDDTIIKKYIPAIIAVFNETGLSGNHSNADGFHTNLKVEYVNNYENPVDLYLANKKLNQELSLIKASRSYRLMRLFIKIKQKFF